LLRIFTAVPMHATCGIIMGFFVGMAKFSKRRFLLNTTGILLAIAIHGSYDYFLFVKDYPALVVISVHVLAAAILFSFIAMRKSSRLSPFKIKK
jgi:protease PrsW